MKLLRRVLLVSVILGIVPGTGVLYAQQNDEQINALQSSSTVKADLIYFDALKARLAGDDKQAETLLEEFIKQKPNASGAYYDLARVCLRQNKTEKAVANIRKAIELEDANPWYKGQYAEILVSQNKYEEAANLYASMAKTEKYNEDYLLTAARLYQFSGRLKEAMAVLDKLVEKNNDEDILLQQQQLYLKMNDVDGAVKVVQKLIAMNPQEGKYYTLLADIYDNNKKHDKAIEVYNKMEAQFKDDPAVQMSLAEYYRKNNDEAKYKEYIEKAITNKALDAETQLSLLIDYMQRISDDKRSNEEGIRLAKKVVEQHADNAQVLAIYGDILNMSDQREAAAEQYKMSLAADPAQYKVWQSLVLCYSDRKQADSMLKYSERSLKVFPNQAILHYLNGVAHMNKGEQSAAVKSVNRAIDMQPEDNKQLLADMYSALGDIYNTLKEYGLSDSSFDIALKYAPDNATVLNNYSYYLSLRKARLDDAERMSKRSLEIRKDEVTFMDTYGWILYQQKKYDKAKEYIQKAIDNNPANTDATLYEHMGDVMYRLNNVDKAVEYWKLAKDKGSENKEIDKKINDRKLYE